MLDKKLFTELVDKCINDISNSKSLDSGSLKDEVLSTVQSVLHKTLSNLDLVTREQFDIQSKVLAQAQQKLELLSNKITELEKTQNKL